MIDRDEQVNLHFVCFVNVNNELYELDGRHPHPIKHAVQLPSGQSLDLLRVREILSMYSSLTRLSLSLSLSAQSTKDVIVKLIETSGGDIRFSMMALTKLV